MLHKIHTDALAAARQWVQRREKGRKGVGSRGMGAGTGTGTGTGVQETWWTYRVANSTEGRLLVTDSVGG
jgi:hypothetical protein